MTSTLDNVSKGRLILGLGIGDKLSRNELHSFGYRFAPLNERIGRLRETIQILKALWTQEETSFSGKYFQISRARNYPKPVQNPYPQTWVGGKHHMLLDVVAETADGWNYWGLKRSDLIERENYLHSKCIELNRTVGTIIKSWTGTVPIDSKAKTQADLVDSVSRGLLGQTDGRTDYFIGAFPEGADSRVYQAFADAVSSIV
jgi:alkanesulfonate monooxygenase SsuD/methylene tetrahydromethanopterin reductase-like flavin-dependent oxidoreductase (luciferase family)